MTLTPPPSLTAIDGPGATSRDARPENIRADDRRTALVVGGGLGGIASGLSLADAGWRVTLIETRKRLGGRATSFNDPLTGETLDNCQHVLMKCCTHLLALYRRLGVEDLIEWRRTFYFCDPAGRVDTLEADDLPAPAHLTRAFLGFRSLSLADKLAIGRGMLAMMRLSLAGRQAWHDRSFGDWLRAHGQTPGAIRGMWAPTVVSALNEWPDDAAADYAIQVFQEGFLANADAHWMGVSRAPLVRLYDAAVDALEQAGGSIRLGAAARAIHCRQGRIQSIELASGEQLQADDYILAVPFDRLHALADQALLDAEPAIARLDQLQPSPIIGIHLWVDPVMDLPHAAFTDSPLHWIFNKGAAVSQHPQAPGFGRRQQHLHGVISAAYDLTAMDADALARLTVRELERLVGRRVRLHRHLVVKEKRASFSIRPGVDRLRPGASTAIENLYLAGDWCDSGWPATMEGATRSGVLAAAAVMRKAGVTPPDLPADLPAAWLYRALASP